MQRTDEWFASRLGKFTSSRINDLMGIKGLGKTGETYAFELACEIVNGRNMDDDFVSFDMQRGIDLEPYAFEKFSELAAEDFLKVSQCGFFELDENTGGSPDGIVSDNSVLEIKCPKPNKFFRLVADNNIDQCYIDQMQHQMLVTGSIQAYFFNFCIYNGDPLYHQILVKRDQKRIDLMIERIAEATIIRNNFINQLNNNKQWKQSK
jgi:exodeoxyribonuclease (lambda-induced)